ncbi:Serine/threonine protein kinase [Thermomonospora echinospora]|uniref:Serine/threonine protein kinase n=1 Tax=Thermomonospora echinospora TaxID=1992 RepID=A0A1H5SYP1_9ACTN|nr:protein kinase [Thermomonospora echinospora]SEF55615.1 Serine/threonine protein kinase [Thermomonospora echinospora]
MSAWRLEGYSEVGELGAGSQGRVVLARHGTSGAYVAIKYVTGPELQRGQTRSDDDSVARSRYEAQMLSSVRHEHVARLHEVVESRHGIALVMEAIEGVPLKRLLSERGPLAPEAALAVLKGSLLGLAAAHAVGVVHRDYKPANVIVRSDGVSKLIDFGVATPAGLRSTAGTPAYMAPEQWRREQALPATDVYAATCVFFECVTGHRPYRATGAAAMAAQHLQAPVPVEEVPEPLRGLVAHGMAKDLRERPAEAAAFVDELEAAAVAAYGEDWERRGVAWLAAAAVALAALFPLAALMVPGGQAAGGAAAHLAEAGTRTGRAGRVLGTGSAKAAATIVAAAVVVAGAAVVFALNSSDTNLTTPRAGERPPAGPSVTPTPSPPSSPTPTPSTPTPTPGQSEVPPTATLPAVDPGDPNTPGPDDPDDPGGPPTPGPTAGPTPEPTSDGQCPSSRTLEPHDFGTVVVGGSAAETFSFPWSPCYDAGGITIRGASAAAFSRELTGCPPEAATGTCTFRITYTPTTAGTHTATLVVPFDDGGDAVTLALSGTGSSSDCFFHAETRDLGSVPVGSSRTEGFSYPWRECDAEDQMTVVGGNGQFKAVFTQCPPPAGDDSCYYDVTFAPRAAGVQTAVMVIPSDTGGQAVRITLTGTGTEAQAESAGTTPSPEPSTPTPEPGTPEPGTPDPGTPDPAPSSPEPSTPPSPDPAPKPDPESPDPDPDPEAPEPETPKPQEPATPPKPAPEPEAKPPAPEPDPVPEPLPESTPPPEEAAG